jgi:DNA-binding NarL/FixJ family response regulator
MQNPPKVMLADDQTMSREGLAELLASRGSIDVVILQVESPLGKAKDTLSELLQILSPQKIVMVTTLEDVSDGFSVEKMIGETRTTTLASIGNNTSTFLPRQALRLAEAGSGGELTGRELEILVLAARGFSNRQIGVSLHISEGTVKRHLVNVYAKMKVGSRWEAANKALSEGWITLRDIAWREEKRR